MEFKIEHTYLELYTKMCDPKYYSLDRNGLLEHGLTEEDLQKLKELGSIHLKLREDSIKSNLSPDEHERLITDFCKARDRERKLNELGI